MSKSYIALAVSDDDTVPPGWPPGWVYPPPPHPPGWVDPDPYYSDYWNGGWSSSGAFEDSNFNARWLFLETGTYTVTVSGGSLFISGQRNGCSVTFSTVYPGESSYTINIPVTVGFNAGFGAQWCTLAFRGSELQISQDRVKFRHSGGSWETELGDYSNGTWRYTVVGSSFTLKYNETTMFSGPVSASSFFSFQLADAQVKGISLNLGAFRVLDSQSDEISLP